MPHQKKAVKHCLTQHTGGSVLTLGKMHHLLNHKQTYKCFLQWQIFKERQIMHFPLSLVVVTPAMSLGSAFSDSLTEPIDFLSLSSFKTQRRREGSFRWRSHLKRKHSWANGFQNLLGKNYKSRSAENPDLGTGTPVLLFELQSADTVAIGFTRWVWKARCFLVLEGGEGKNSWILNYVLANTCLKLNYTLVITSITKQKY